MQSEQPKFPEIKLPNSAHQPGLKQPQKNKLNIILISSVIFLVLSLIAGGIFTYLYLSPKAPVEFLPDKRDAATVKKVEWIAPTMPEGYVLHYENTDFTTSAVHQNDSVGCKITAKIETSPAEPLKGDGEVYYIKDVDMIHEYDFASLADSQSVNAPGTNVSTLTGVKVFKQFNYQLASLSYMCKSDVWESKKPELADLIKQFTVKTERVEE